MYIHSQVLPSSSFHTSPTHTTLSQYEEKVLCEKPANCFGPKFEYINFPILDPKDERFSFQVCIPRFWVLGSGDRVKGSGARAD